MFEIVTSFGILYSEKMTLSVNTYIDTVSDVGKFFNVMINKPDCFSPFDAPVYLDILKKANVSYKAFLV